MRLSAPTAATNINSVKQTEQQITQYKVKLPPGLKPFLEDLTREVIKKQPTNIIWFASDYFNRKLEERARDVGPNDFQTFLPPEQKDRISVKEKEFPSRRRSSTKDRNRKIIQERYQDHDQRSSMKIKELLTKTPKSFYDKKYSRRYDEKWTSQDVTNYQYNNRLRRKDTQTDTEEADGQKKKSMYQRLSTKIVTEGQKLRRKSELPRTIKESESGTDISLGTRTIGIQETTCVCTYPKEARMSASFIGERMIRESKTVPRDDELLEESKSISKEENLPEDRVIRKSKTVVKAAQLSDDDLPENKKRKKERGVLHKAKGAVKKNTRTSKEITETTLLKELPKSKLSTKEPVESSKTKQRTNPQKKSQAKAKALSPSTSKTKHQKQSVTKTATTLTQPSDESTESKSESGSATETSESEA